MVKHYNINLVREHKSLRVSVVLNCFAISIWIGQMNEVQTLVCMKQCLGRGETWRLWLIHISNVS